MSVITDQNKYTVVQSQNQQLDEWTLIGICNSKTMRAYQSFVHFSIGFIDRELKLS